MAVHATNKTNLASIKTAIATFGNNASLATGTERTELLKLARRLEREIDAARIQGL